MAHRLQARQVCPMCGDDDDVVAFPKGVGQDWVYTCTAKRHASPYQWAVKVEERGDGREGITAELGLYDDLPRCVVPGEPWVEHGVVEHRYKLLRPDIYFDELLPRYGHVADDWGRKPYTVSAFIAKTLGQLHREGAFAWQEEKATGFWKYNGRISYWAVPPAPPVDQRLTWASFASTQGLDPAVWDIVKP
jgi:hypothetical protein